MNARPAIVVATSIPSSVRSLLDEHAEVTDVSALGAEERRGPLNGAFGVLVSSVVPFGADAVAAASKLQIIASVSVGTNNIAVDEAHRRGIAVTNSRGSLIAAVADLAYVLVAVVVRRIGEQLAWVQEGHWDGPNIPFGHDLEGATLGIVGFGQIGRALALRAQVSGMKVIYASRTPATDDAQTGAVHHSFDDLLAESDCVIALVPLTAQTEGMFNDSVFGRMKPGATFVNVARGKVVDTAALLRAVDCGRLAAVALDVTDPEPIGAEHPLARHPKIMVTPHVGSATHETRTRMAMLAARNLIAAINGEPLLTPVSATSGLAARREEAILGNAGPA